MKTCKTCINNITMGKGCNALTTRIETKCWAWMDKPMHDKVIEDMKKYSEEGGRLYARSYNKRSKLGLSS